MSGFSNSQEAAILNHFFGKATWTAPTNIHVALSTANPTDDGSLIAEPAGNAYARVLTAAADWNTASGTAPAVTSNNAVITFPEATGAWGTITHFALYDAATAGTFLGSGALGTSKAVNAGDTPRFSVGALLFKLGDPTDTF